MKILISLYVVAMMVPTAKIADVKICELLLLPLLANLFTRPYLTLPKKLFFLFFLFFSLSFLSFLASYPVSDYNPDPLTGMKAVHVFNLVRFTQLLFGFSVFAFFCSVKSKKEIFSLVSMYCWFNTFLSAVSLLCYGLYLTTGFKTSNVYVDSWSFAPQLMSFAFVEPSPFAIFLVPSLFLSFYLKRKISFAVQAFAFSLTMSAQGLIAAFVVFALVAVRRHPIRGVALVITGIALIMQVPILYNIIVGKLLALATTEISNTTLGGRHAAWFILPVMIDANPVLGIGFGNYTFLRNLPEYLGAAPLVQGDESLMGFLQILAETGLVGFTAFLAMIIPLISVCLKGINPNATPLQKGIACGCLALWFNLLGTSYLTFHQLWFFAGLAFAAHRLKKECDTDMLFPSKT